MRTKLCCTMLMLIVFLPMMVSADTTLTLSVAESVYQKGEIVYLSGNGIAGQSVDIYVYYVDGEDNVVVRMDTVTSNSEGDFSSQFTLSLSVEEGDYFAEAMQGSLTSNRAEFKVSDTEPPDSPTVPEDVDMFHFVEECGDYMTYNDVYVSPQWDDIAVTIQYFGNEPIDGITCTWKGGGDAWVTTTENGKPTFSRVLSGGTYFNADDERLCSAVLTFKAIYLDPNQDFHHEILVFDKKWRDSEGMPHSYYEDTGSYLFEMHVFFWYKAGTPYLSIVGDKQVGNQLTISLVRDGTLVSTSELSEVRIFNPVAVATQFFGNDINNPMTLTPSLAGNYSLLYYDKYGVNLLTQLITVTENTAPPTTAPPTTAPPTYTYLIHFSDTAMVGTPLTITLLENGDTAPSSLVQSFQITGAGISMTNTGVNTLQVTPTVADTLQVNVHLTTGNNVTNSIIVSPKQLPTIPNTSFSIGEGVIALMLPVNMNVNCTIEYRATESGTTSIWKQFFKENNEQGSYIYPLENNGQYRATVNVDGYETYVSQWVSYASDEELVVSYTSIFFNSSTRSIVLEGLNPYDATIKILDANGTMVTNSNLSKGMYSVILEKTGYTSTSTSFQVPAKEGGFNKTHLIIIGCALLITAGVILYRYGTHIGKKPIATSTAGTPEEIVVQNNSGIPREPVTSDEDMKKKPKPKSEDIKMSEDYPTMGGKRRM